jgi:hypothetical protein
VRDGADDPRIATPENIQFYRQHKSEIDRILEGWRVRN